MNSTFDASNNNSNNATERVDNNPVNDIFDSDDVLSSEANNSSQHLEDMEVDESVGSDGLYSRHSDDVSKASDEISSLEGKRSEYELKISQFLDKIDQLMELPFSVDEADRNARKGEIEHLQFYVDNLKSRIVTTNDLIASYRETKVKLIAQEKKLNAVDAKVSKDNSYLRIQMSDLPIFDVTPMYERKLATTDSADGTDAYMDLRNGDKSLNAFIARFERVDAMRWYTQFIKDPIKLQKKQMNWDQVKKLLRDGFDVAENADLLYCNEYLSKIQQGQNEHVVSYVMRFGNYLAGAKINTGDCLYFIVHFLNSLRSKKLKEKILQVLKDEHYENALKSGLGSSADSKWASPTKRLPKSFLEFASIINNNFREFDIFVLEHAKHDHDDSSSSSSSNSNNNKKRKMNPSADNSAKKDTSKPSSSVDEISKLLALLDVSRPLNKSERQAFVKLGYCSFCRFNKFTKGHNCDARKEYYDNIKSKK